MRKLILLFFLFYFASLNYANAQLIRKIPDLPIKYTPLMDVIIQEKERYLRDFPFLLIELRDDSSSDELERQISLVLNRDFSICLNVKDEINVFCQLYITLFLMGTDSSDLEQFFSEKQPFSDIAYLGKTFFFAINSNLEEAKKTSRSVKDRAVKVYFKQLFEIFDEEFDKIDFDRIDLIETQAKIFKHYKRFPEIIYSLLQKNNLPPSLYYILGEKYFNDGDFLKAGDCFLIAARYENFNQIALKNAFYSYLNADNIERAKEVLLKINSIDRRLLECMLDLKLNKARKIEESMLNDEIFTAFLLEHVKSDLKKGKKISYLSEIGKTTDNEELSFMIAVSKMIYEKHLDYVNFLERIEWKNSHYRDALIDIKMNVFKENSSLEKLIQRYSLFNYYPFNFFYANMIKNKNDRLAEKLYENVIRYHKKPFNENVLKSYVNLASIYKKRGKYYTAIKILEDALKLELKKEEILMEIVRLFALKEDYVELKWRAEKLLKETENVEFKKELQIFINLCYEKLNTIKESETK